MAKSKKRKHSDTEEYLEHLNDLNKSSSSKHNFKNADHNIQPVDVEVVTIKKKKKRLKETIKPDFVLPVDCVVGESLVKNKSKKKKKKRELAICSLDDDEVVHINNDDKSSSNNSKVNNGHLNTKLKKKKRKKENAHMEEKSSEYVASKGNLTIKKKKKKKKSSISDQSLENPKLDNLDLYKDETNTETISSKNKKLTETVVFENRETENENISIKKKKKKRKLIAIEDALEKEKSEHEVGLMKKEKKHKKNSKENDHEDNQISYLNESTMENKTIKKKNKKSKYSDILNEPITLEKAQLVDGIKHDNNDIFFSDEKSNKKYKKKKKTKVVKGEKKYDHEKKNTQNKTEDEKKYNTNRDTSTVHGQWKGNLFENEERHNKFLRLLGGMKKTSSEVEIGKTNEKGLFSSSKTNRGNGLFGSLGKTIKGKGLFGSLRSENHVSNVALSVNAAETLNSNLEKDFNKALNMKLTGSQSFGLGFTKDPAEGKKFHIDTTKVNSKIFDE